MRSAATAYEVPRRVHSSGASKARRPVTMPASTGGPPSRAASGRSGAGTSAGRSGAGTSAGRSGAGTSRAGTSRAGRSGVGASRAGTSRVEASGVEASRGGSTSCSVPQPQAYETRAARQRRRKRRAGGGIGGRHHTAPGAAATMARAHEMRNPGRLEVAQPAASLGFGRSPAPQSNEGMRPLRGLPDRNPMDPREAILEGRSSSCSEAPPGAHAFVRLGCGRTPKPQGRRGLPHLQPTRVAHLVTPVWRRCPTSPRWWCRGSGATSCR